MKIVYIYGNAAHNDNGLSKVIGITRKIFEELGVETETLDLDVIHPPYYDGDTTQGMDKVMDTIKVADGLVFASTAQLFSPTALMQTFLEYFEHPEYMGILANKHCFLIALSKKGCEKSALDYLGRVIQHFGGFTKSQLGLQSEHILALEVEESFREFIDKETEDFYRAVKQNRKYIIPRDYDHVQLDDDAVYPTITEGFTNDNTQSINHARREAQNTMIKSQNKLKLINTKPQSPMESLQNAQTMSNLQQQLSNFTKKQEDDIDEISNLFVQKYGGQENPENLEMADTPATALFGQPPAAVPPQMFAPIMQNSTETSSPRAKTARQMTASLPHYFQPQLSAGAQMVIQINISGAETFDGYLYIHSTECQYTEGSAPSSDITIMADTSVWMDVLKSKQTAQKAFMMGGLKVRGDFVLLTKFDTLFKLK